MLNWPAWRKWEKEYKDIIHRYSNTPGIDMSEKLRQLANKMNINIGGAGIQGTVLKEIIYIDSCIKEGIREAKYSFLVWAAIASACASMISAIVALIAVLTNP